MQDGWGSTAGESEWVQVWRRGRSAVFEDREGWPEESFQERHLQCVWFDPRFRPADLVTSDGEAVIVEQPGRWNLEAGPDFWDARLRIGTPGRCLAGDIEIHIHPEDWLRHGHGADPRYRRVAAHVTYYGHRLETGLLPPGAVQIALRDPLRKMSGFSFEALDLTAYPYALRGACPPCAGIVRGWPPDRVAAFLEAAGLERIARKTARLRSALERRGAGQVLYEETLTALGYKANRRPFRELAVRVPRSVLAEEAAGDPDRAYALLCGVSGLLPAALRPDWDETTRRYVRRIWDDWWKFQARHGGSVMAVGDWVLSGLRPANHPLRRMALAALWFGRAPDGSSVEEEIARRPVAEWPDHLERALDRLTEGSYWRRRYGFGGRPTTEPMALLGADRCAAWLVNVLAPWAMAARRWIPADDAEWRGLPAEELNSLIRQAAQNLLGPDHNPAIYRSGLCRQGLIQIFSEFCLNQAADCAACPIPNIFADR